MTCNDLLQLKQEASICQEEKPTITHNEKEYYCFAAGGENGHGFISQDEFDTFSDDLKNKMFRQTDRGKS